MARPPDNVLDLRQADHPDGVLPAST